METTSSSESETRNCLLCGRILGADVNRHHLIPRTFNGEETVVLHRICHDFIHHSLSERELANYYHTIDRLLEKIEIANFVKWVKSKHPDFYIRIRDTAERNRKR